MFDAKATAFRARIDEANAILDELGLVDRRNYQPSYKGLAKSVRKLHYREEWAHYESKALFDIQLKDGSLFQFKDRPEEHTDVSYCFYDSPLDVDDYETFIKATFDMTVDEVGEDGRDEFEQYLSTAGLKRAVTMVRYDYSPGLYREGCHPSSHLHIGHNNHVRLGTRRVMSPISFTLFVLRQAYPHHWEMFVAGTVSNRIDHVRKSLVKVHSDCFKNKDTWEIYLE